MISVSTLMVLTATALLTVPDMDMPNLAVSGVKSPLATVAVTADEQWLQSFEDAKAIAQKKNLPLLLHFEADWCGACRTMEASVMNQDVVLEHLGKSVVAVRVNADHDPGLIAQYGIASLPTEVFIGVDGHEIRRYVGVTSLSDYIARLQNLQDAQDLSTQPSVGETVDENLRPCLLVIREGNMVGLGGFSPVAMLKEKKWLKGKEDVVGSFLGVDYFFQSKEERELFLSNPEQFVPQLHGCDPVELQLARRAEAGVIELGAFYKGRLFFFMSEENRQRFQNNPAWYAEGMPRENILNAEEFPFLKSMMLN